MSEGREKKGEGEGEEEVRWEEISNDPNQHYAGCSGGSPNQPTQRENQSEGAPAVFMKVKHIGTTA